MFKFILFPEFIHSQYIPTFYYAQVVNWQNKASETWQENTNHDNQKEIHSE